MFDRPRDWFWWAIAILALALPCAHAAFGQVTIEPPAQVVAGRPNLFPVRGLAAEEIGRVTVQALPSTCKAALLAGPFGGQFVWFEPAAEGTHSLTLAIGTDGKPYMVGVLVEVGGDGPQPQPDPQPGPDPNPLPPGLRKIVVVIEANDQTPAQAATIHGLRQYVDSQQHQYALADPDKKEADKVTPARWLQPYLRAIQQRGVELPVLIVDAPPLGSVEAGDVVEVLPGTGAEAIATVEGAGG